MINADECKMRIENDSFNTKCNCKSKVDKNLCRANKKRELSLPQPMPNRKKLKISNWSSKRNNYSLKQLCKGRGLATMSTLTYAFCFGDIDTVKYLQEKQNTKINLEDNNGLTPLLYSCYCSNIPVAKFLLTEYEFIDVNVVCKKGNSPLHYSIWNSQEDDTDLHLACLEGDFGKVFQLIIKKCDMINKQNNDGNTPLHLACRLGIRKLRRLEGNKNKKRSLIAELQNINEIVTALILSGCDETITNEKREPPAEKAFKKGYKNVIKKFEQ